VRSVHEFFGGPPALDPCSNKSSIVGARTEYILPRRDGLKHSWNFKTIYVNPPYGRAKDSSSSIYDWLEKCCHAHLHYGAEVLALVPVATNTSHWKSFVFGKACAVSFLADTRLRFLVDGKEDNKGAPMSCCMIYWGRDISRFERIYAPYGAVVALRTDNFPSATASQSDSAHLLYPLKW
jgi:hypothetical protein